MLISSYGLDLYAWQQLVLDSWCARDSADRPTYTTCGLSVPRQNGKNAILEAYEVYMLAVCGAHVLHTAHRVRTAKESFGRLVRYFAKGSNPELEALVEKIRYTNGEEAISLKNGGRIEFSARSSAGSRGFADIQVVVFDEAQDLTDAQLSALMYTLAASRTGDRQMIYTGTPPGPSSPGTVFHRIRDSVTGMREPKRTCWHEWSVESMPDATAPFVDVLESVFVSNPSMGRTLDIEWTEDEFNKAALDEFSRERLGWWTPIGADTPDSVISADEWGACRTDNPTREGVVAYAVKFSTDGKTGVLAACHRPKDADPFVYVVASRNMTEGIAWFADTLSEHWRECAEIVIDGASHSEALQERLIEMRVPARRIKRPRARDVMGACSSLVNAVRERRITHYGQPALDASATLTTRRSIGSYGGWGFQSTEAGDATLIEAACLAYWAAMTTKRKPGRKAVIR